MTNDPREKDPRDDNTTREYERLIDRMYGREDDDEAKNDCGDDE